MKYFEKDIVKEGCQILREKCTKVNLPLSSDDLACIRGLYEYVLASAIDDLVKQFGIRPGVGIAAPQVGVTKRMFAMNADDFLDEKGTKYNFAVINPQIIEKSEQLTYLPGGEGCLSVDRPTPELVTPRHYWIEAKCTLLDFNTNKLKSVKLKLAGYPAIVFQHEYDHLDGVMYVDKMYKVDKLDKDILPLYTVDEDEEDSEDNQE